MERDDDALWRDVRQGQSDAMAVLFRRHADVLYNYCFRRVGNWSTAEELVSIVFLEAWRRRKADVQPGMVLAWLYGIATNVVRNRRRSERRYAAAVGRMPAERPSPDLSDDVVARTDDERRMRQLLGRVAQLPRHEQDVLALCGWSELTYEEAAAALGVPVGTVRSRLSRARNRLRELDQLSGHEASAERSARHDDDDNDAAESTTSAS